MLVLHNRDSTVTVRATQLTILPSPKRTLSLAQRMDGSPGWRPHRNTYPCHIRNLPDASDARRNHATFRPEGRRPQVSHSDAPAPPTSPSIITQGELPITEVRGWLRTTLIISALPECHPWLQRPQGGRLPLGVPGTPARLLQEPLRLPLPSARDTLRAQSQGN